MKVHVVERYGFRADDLVIVEVPPKTESKLKLKANRELTERGGYGVARKLPRIENTPAVYWSEKHSNSYVVVATPTGYNVLSINGIGEIRWTLDPHKPTMEGNQNGDSAAQEVFDYFFE